MFAALDPDDLARALELWEQTLRRRPGSPRRPRFASAAATARRSTTEVVANNLLDDPAVHGIVMTIRDVTERKRSERALRDSEARVRESEARYRAVVDDQIELVCRYLPDTTITFVNRAFADFYGRARDELIGSPLVDLHPPAVRHLAFERLPGVPARRTRCRRTTSWSSTPAASRRCYRWIDRAFLDADGNVVEVQSVGHDVTEERRASVLTENQADILEQVARGVPLDETLAAIASTVEQHFPRLCGVPCSSTDPAAQGIELRRSVDRRRFSRPTGARGSAPSPCYGSDAESPDAEQRSIFSLVAHLASIAIERKAFEDRLAHQSMHDPLTGLPNRLLFLDRLSLAVARGRRTDARVRGAVPRPRPVQERQRQSRSRRRRRAAGFGGAPARRRAASGRHGGALRRRRVHDPVRRPAATIAREPRHSRSRSGCSTPLAPAVRRAQRGNVRRRERRHRAHHHRRRRRPTSCCATPTPRCTTPRKRAAVASRSSTTRFASRALARHATENALHRAIERGELRLFFQPIVRLEDARCIGAEALVRWQHPERGLVPPGRVHPARRGHRAHRPARRVGARARGRASGALAARTGRVHGVGQPVGAPAREPDLAEQRRRRCIARTGLRPDEPLLRDHRERVDGGRRRARCT